MTLRDFERHAAEAILDRPNADPDDDAAIVARAALRLAATPVAEGLRDAAAALVDEWDAAMAGDIPLNGHYQKQALDRLRAAIEAVPVAEKYPETTEYPLRPLRRTP